MKFKSSWLLLAAMPSLWASDPGLRPKKVATVCVGEDGKEVIVNWLVLLHGGNTMKMWLDVSDQAVVAAPKTEAKKRSRTRKIR